MRKQKIPFELLNSRPVNEVMLDQYEIPEQPAFMQDLLNSNGDYSSADLGFRYAIDTTTLMRVQTVRQRFFKIAPADFLTIEVGNGAYLENITTNLSYGLSGDFESGYLNLAAQGMQSPEIKVARGHKTYPIQTWSKGYTYNLIEIQKALKGGNWDEVREETDFIKKVSDLGLQKATFMGTPAFANMEGLLTLSEPTIDTTAISKPLKSMDAGEFQSFIENILGLYAANAEYVDVPDTFLMPFDDFTGLAGYTSDAFQIRTKISVLIETFQALTGNKNFKIAGIPYCMSTKNAGFVSALGKQRYMLYKNDPEVVRMDIPVPFTLTAPATPDNFNWNGRAYLQHTGVQCFLPKLVYYMDQTEAL